MTSDRTWLTPQALADRCGMSTGTLANWRSQGTRGPRYFRVEGVAVRYALADVLAWETLQETGKGLAA